MITLRSQEELLKLEQASRIVLETLDLVEKAVAPGVTTCGCGRAGTVCRTPPPALVGREDELRAFEVKLQRTLAGRPARGRR